jgi:energy-coupling factor transporter ATP-binding protein EcfA2
MGGMWSWGRNKDVTKEGLPIQRFRFHGLRKLNWAERAWRSDYLEHMADAGFDRWIEPGRLMIVVGPNAGGKSTVIDLFRALANAQLWPGLQRENYPGADFSGFDIEGAEYRLSARFSKYTPDSEQMFDWATIIAVAQRGDDRRSESVLANKYGDAGDWVGPLQDLVDDLVRVPVDYFPATGGYPADELDDAALVSLLNELSPHFPSVFANSKLAPFNLFKGSATAPGRIGILFKDDTSQHGFVHRNSLPLGWLQIVSVLAFMRRCRSGALILLDEPDRHLHPSLQRVMLEMIATEGHRLNAQIIIATHSSVLTNPELGRRVGAKAVVVARGRCEELVDARRVLDDLGVTSGDLVQANGLIWVEGPSDRLYLKSWIELCARAKGFAAPIERVHYAFVSYGGALLKHLALSDASSEKLDLRAVNRNFFIVIDRDMSAESLEPLASEKRRFLHEAEALGRLREIWVTQHYTIESYLPAGWDGTQRFVSTAPEGRTRVIGIDKVDLASRFQREASCWEKSFRADTDVPERISDLLAMIQDWQTPQEIVHTTFLPPFLQDGEDVGADGGRPVG